MACAEPLKPAARNGPNHWCLLDLPSMGFIGIKILIVAAGMGQQIHCCWLEDFRGPPAIDDRVDLLLTVDWGCCRPPLTLCHCHRSSLLLAIDCRRCSPWEEDGLDVARRCRSRLPPHLPPAHTVIDGFRCCYPWEVRSIPPLPPRRAAARDEGGGCGRCAHRHPCCDGRIWEGDRSPSPLLAGRRRAAAALPCTLPSTAGKKISPAAMAAGLGKKVEHRSSVLLWCAAFDAPALNIM
ncbi:hypothetical protein ACLOJK_019127 [Asimina triloba]